MVVWMPTIAIEFSANRQVEMIISVYRERGLPQWEKNRIPVRQSVPDIERYTFVERIPKAEPSEDSVYFP